MAGDGEDTAGKSSLLAAMPWAALIAAGASFGTAYLTGFFEKSKTEITQAHQLDVKAIELQHTTFDKLVFVDPAGLAVDEGVTSADLDAKIDNERKARICFAVTFGIIEVPEHVLGVAKADLRAYSVAIDEFLQERYNCEEVEPPTSIPIAKAPDQQPALPPRADQSLRMSLFGLADLTASEQTRVLDILGPPGQPDGSYSPDLVEVSLPDGLPVSWSPEVRRTFLTAHSSIACHLEWAMQRIHAAGFWPDLTFGGDYAPRPLRGSEGRWSVHSWGIAFDFNPEQNGLRMTREEALFGQPRFAKMLDIFEEAGFHSSGRLRNSDFMQIQASPRQILGEAGPATCRAGTAPKDRK